MLQGRRSEMKKENSRLRDYIQYSRFPVQMATVRVNSLFLTVTSKVFNQHNAPLLLLTNI